jgi:hypothetical protein
MAEQEMTLDEYVGVLPRGHRAHEELAKLKGHKTRKTDDDCVVVSRGVYDRLRDLVISFARRERLK